MPFPNGTSSSSDLPTVPLWIAGKSHGAETSSTFPIISAATSKTVHHAVSASTSQANLACDSAAEALIKWRRTSPTHRRKLLLKVADIYDRRIDEIANYQIAETCCPPQFAFWNTMMAARYTREIATATGEIRGIVPQRDTDDDGTEADGLTIVTTEPIGTVLVIPP